MGKKQRVFMYIPPKPHWMRYLNKMLIEWNIHDLNSCGKCLYSSSCVSHFKQLKNEANSDLYRRMHMMNRDLLQDDFNYQLKSISKPNSPSKLYLSWSMFSFLATVCENSKWI